MVSAVDKLHIGVVGVGHMGAYHVNVLKTIKDIDFVGIHDLNMERAHAIGSEYSVPVYKELSELLKVTDAVILATPTSTHYELAAVILAAGKHVLVEKPLTAGIEEAERLFALATQKNLKLFIGHVERYNGAVQELDKLVTQPYCWESRRVGPGSRRIQDSGVGLDLMIHDIDICLRTLKSKVTSAYARGIYLHASGRYEDAISAQLTFANGCLATFFATRLSHQKERALTVTNDHSSLILDFTTQAIHIHRLGQAMVTTHPQELRYKQQASVERLFIHKANPLVLELEDFIATVRQDIPINSAMELQSLAITLQLVEQAYTHKS